MKEPTCFFFFKVSSDRSNKGKPNPLVCVCVWQWLVCVAMVSQWHRVFGNSLGLSQFHSGLGVYGTGLGVYDTGLGLWRLHSLSRGYHTG